MPSKLLVVLVSFLNIATRTSPSPRLFFHRTNQIMSTFYSRTHTHIWLAETSGHPKEVLNERLHEVHMFSICGPRWLNSVRLLRSRPLRLIHRWPEARVIVGARIQFVGCFHAPSCIVVLVLFVVLSCKVMAPVVEGGPHQSVQVVGGGPPVATIVVVVVKVLLTCWDRC